MAESTDLAPFEWLTRLGPKLRDKQDQLALWQRYYDGDQDLPSGPAQHREAYKRFQALARTNLCKLCADSRVHRMQVTGYTDGTAGGGNDQTVWAHWQRSRFDSRQFSVYRKAFTLGQAYVWVGTDPRDPTIPRATIEKPTNVYVEHDEADPAKRLAAIRLFYNSIDGRWNVTLALPGERHYFETIAQNKNSISGDTILKWDPSAWRYRNPGKVRSTAEVCVVPFPNGDEGEEPVSEFDAGLDVQNRLNLTVLNRLTAERYAAFRQRYLLNYQYEVDDTTGLPVAPFNPGSDQTFVIPPPEAGDPEPKFGDLSQTDTTQMLRAVEADMRAFAALTLTPVTYLPGDLTNIGADAVAALDAGHLALIKARMLSWSESWEEVLRLHVEIAQDGDPAMLDSAEIVWARAEQFNPAATADYGSKLRAAGYPLPTVAERMGDSPQQIAQLRAEMAAEKMDQLAMEAQQSIQQYEIDAQFAPPPPEPAPAAGGGDAPPEDAA